MTELFKVVPAAVDVTVSNKKGRKMTFRFAGEDMKILRGSISTAMATIPDGAMPFKKARKKRRSKKESLENDVYIEEKGEK